METYMHFLSALSPLWYNLILNLPWLNSNHHPLKACCCLVAESCLTLLQPHGLQPARLLCRWDFPGKNTGVGCHFHLQGIFPNPHLQPCKKILYHWATRETQTQAYNNWIMKNQNYILVPDPAFPWPTKPSWISKSYLFQSACSTTSHSPDSTSRCWSSRMPFNN